MSGLIAEIKVTRFRARKYSTIYEEDFDLEFIKALATKHHVNWELIYSGDYTELRGSKHDGYTGVIEFEAQEEKFFIYVTWNKENWKSHIIWKDQEERGLDLDKLI